MKWLKSLIYFFKRLIHRRPYLYGPVFSLMTFNRLSFQSLFKKKLFPSRFGGMWTDRSDFESLLPQKIASGDIDQNSEELLRDWHEKGFVVLKSAIAQSLIEDLGEELKNLPNDHPQGLRITGGGELESRLYRPESIKPHDSIRIVDFYFFSELARKILFDKKIVNFLKVAFESKPILTQSLSFEHGSEQEIHQDTAFVIMNAPLNFAASWIALEDIQEGSGELVYYPGSHRWDDFLFSGRFKHWDRERDGEAQLREWYAWMHSEAKRRGTSKEIYRPKKGDVLLWHGGLAHGGSPIKNSSLTRRSLVGHYCASGVRPLYHYYKPAHRNIYEHNGCRFSSSHYTPKEKITNPES